MRRWWRLPALGGWFLLGLAACATGEDPTGAGGDGASSSSGGGDAGGATSASSSAASSSSGGPWLCGNGVIDPGEDCDWTDLGGKTCASFGLGEGTLYCNDYCSFFLLSCGLVERCDDGVDNDSNGKIDCEDSACSAAVTCVDACTPPKILGLPDIVYGTTRGRPSTHEASCSPTSAGEAMYQITALSAGKIALQLQSSGQFTFSLSVRSACGDDESEIACTSALIFGPYTAHVLTFEVVAGETYFVMVDTIGTQPGAFELHVAPWQPEMACNDLLDEDSDGHLDCDDTDCQDRPECAAGATPTGEACGTPSECSANHNDPICLPLSLGFPGGSCAEFCDLAAPDCAAGAVCAQLGISSDGVCLHACLGDGDCRAGYSCQDEGYPQKVCRAAPETSCDDFLDNDGNGVFDCADPSCQALLACAPGPKAPGQPCELHHECSSGSSDPLCITEAFLGWPGGYCSEICDLGADDCPSGSECINWLHLDGGQGTCLQTCDTVADCRPMYGCFDIGAPKKFCVH